MDATKRRKLIEVEYSIPGSCGTCVHVRGMEGRGDWGTCAKFTYEHEKHTDSKRNLSVYRYGGCPSFEAAGDPFLLGGFIEFFRV